MRFLCLHGRGTNSKIFEMQTAAIRYELADHHTYDFVEGTLPWDLDPAFKEVLPGQHDTFAYFNEYHPETALKAIDDLDDIYAAEGPYDGVIAFSQAVGVAVSWMVRRQRLGLPSFECAVLISAAAPCINYDALTQGRLVPLTSAEVGEIIDIPTAHSWGVHDEYAAVARDVSQICRTDKKWVVTHDGGHEVPGSGSKEARAAATKVVQRIRRTALMVQAAA